MEKEGFAVSPAAGMPVASAGVVRHLAHELRQPLSTVESSAFYLQMILQNHPDPRVATHLDRIQNGVQQLDWILSDSIHYLCGAPPRPQLVDLSEILSDVLAEPPFGPVVELDWSYADERVLAVADPGQAQHLVRTALYVFRQIARSEQPMGLGLEYEGDFALLDVWCQVPSWEGDCESLFEPFSPHLPSGSGLALASVRRIAQTHGGCASIRGHAGGLRLQVRLPRN